MDNVVTEIPERFVIRFRTFDGLECEHSVVTWMGRDKAVAVAAYSHAVLHEELVIYQVEVEPRGEIETAADGGGYTLDDDDVTDRMEW